MDELLDLILDPLDNDLAEQVRQRFAAASADAADLDADDLDAADLQALQDFPDTPATDDWWLDPARCRWWLALHVDWKAYDEVEWQVQAIARTLGLDVHFQSAQALEWDAYFDRLDRQPGAQATPTPLSESPTMDVLGEASEWLQGRGYELLYLNTGGDEYLAVPIRLDLLEQAQALAERLGLTTYLV